MGNTAAMGELAMDGGGGTRRRVVMCSSGRRRGEERWWCELSCGGKGAVGCSRPLGCS